MRNLLRLIRIPNSFSAVSNIWTGYILAWAGKSPINWLTVALGAMASLFIYSGGMALNDYADRANDAKEHPERLIPRGIISARTALLIALLFLVTGALIAFTISIDSFIISLLLCLFVALYDISLKKNWFFGGLAMGYCRLFNCALGISLAGHFFTKLPPDWHESYPLTMFIYIFVLTVVARAEKKHPFIEKIVKAGIFIIILIDALFLYIYGPYWWQMAVSLSLLLPMYLLGKRFRMT